MKKILCAAATACVLLGSAELRAGLMGVSTSVDGDIFFRGLGVTPLVPGAPNGVARLRLGDCEFDVGDNKTTCTTTGNYVETAGSDDPGTGGSFSLVQMYTGEIPGFLVTPESPGSASLTSVFLAFDTTFELTLSGDKNLQLLLPPEAFSFSVRGVPTTQQCVDLPNANCSLANVALQPGALLTADIADDGFSFSIPDDEDVSVPAPSSLLLLGIGLAGLARRRQLTRHY